jgi:capsular polysaccharide biosynthesis protein
VGHASHRVTGNRGKAVDLMAFWNVLKRHRRLTVIGLCAAVALALVAMVKPTTSGVSWRTPPVYQAKTTLFVTEPGFPWGRSTLGENQQAEGDLVSRMEFLASLYAQIAESDVIERAVSRQFGILEPEYQAAPITGVEGRPLPLVELTAFETSPDGAVALANGISGALRTYLTREQASNDITGKDRVELRVLEDAREAEVFKGVRLTRPVMLLLLGLMLTVGAAFIVDNVGGGRRSAEAHAGEAETTLGIVRDEPVLPREDEDAAPVPELAARIHPADPETDDAISEASPARGRWARPS